MRARPSPEQGPAGAREGGFTLLETLVVLLLLSFMSVLVVESYRAGLAMWERQHRETSSLEAARAVMERMRAQIKSAFPWSFRDQGKATLYLRGYADSLEFTTLVGLTSRRGNGMLHAVRYGLAESPEGKRLRMEEFSWPRRGFPEGEDPVVGEDVPGIAGIKFSYQIEETTAAARREAEGKAAETAKLRWTDSWPGEGEPKRGETLAAVSVSITMAGEEGEAGEFTTVIPVMRDAPAQEARR